MLPRKRTLLAAATVCAAMTIPAAVASAEDFCVGGPSGCVGTPVAANGLKAALAAAQSNGSDDRFILAPGVYSADVFSHKSAERVQIIGAGQGKTTLRGSLADDAVLWLEGNPASSVSSLSVQAASVMTAGLMLDGADARQVTVGVDGAGFTGFGAALVGGATFDDSRVDLGTNSGYAVAVLNGTVTGSTLRASGGTGVVAYAGTAVVRRSTLSAAAGGVADGARLTIADSVISGGQFGALADPGFGNVGTVSTVDLERVTIVGSKYGVFAQADKAGDSAMVHMSDSVISGSLTPVARVAFAGANATVVTDRSVYPAAAQAIDTGPGKVLETSHLAVDARFVDEAGGDFHLAAGSPLIDAGTPDGVPAGAVDRDGKPRASDGNGDCVPVSDIGAFEYQAAAAAACTAAPATGGAVTAPAATAAPRISRLRVEPTGVQIGTALPKLVRTTVRRPLSTIQFRLSQPATVTLRFAKIGRNGTTRTLRPTLKIKSRKGRNRIRFAAHLTRKVALAPGAYRVTAVATTKAGARSKPARARFTAIASRRAPL